MFDINGTTCKRSKEVDLGSVEEIVASSLETGVWLLLDLKLNVTRLHAWHLISLSRKVQLCTALNTFVNVDVEDLSLDDSLLALACFASVLITNHLSLTLTVWADSLEALDHRTHLSHHSLHTRTTATCAGLDSTLLASSSLARRADDGLLQCKLGNLALVDILKCDLMHVMNCACLLWASVPHSTAHTAAEDVAETTASEKRVKQVLGGHATTTHATLLEAILAILVVYLALLRV